MKQKITSKETSISTLNKSYKDIKEKYPDGTVILDYGCGKYNKNRDFARLCGYEWYGYDPYNRTDLENAITVSKFEYETPDVIMCNNVLNVLEDEDLILAVMKDVLRFAGLNTDVYFTIYEGDGSGVGRETTKGFQQNQKTDWYLRKLSGNIETTKKGNIIKCRKVA